MTHNIIHTPRKTNTLRKFRNRLFQRSSHRTSLSETGSRSLTSELSVQRPEGASYGGSQIWFSSPSIRGYGCGLIAAHDLLWYLERKESLTAQTDRHRSGEQLVSDSRSWEDYERSVKRLHRLFPILPRLGINGLMLSAGLNLASYSAVFLTVPAGISGIGIPERRSAGCLVRISRSFYPSAVIFP